MKATLFITISKEINSQHKVQKEHSCHRHQEVGQSISMISTSFWAMSTLPEQSSLALGTHRPL